MAEVIKVYKESLPALRLIGKRYTNNDRDQYGSYGAKWGEWFQNGWFEILESLGSLPENEGAYLGCMRCIDEFEYWIGMFFPENTPVPDDFSYIDIPKGDIAVCWVYGREDNGEIYGEQPHNMCLEKIKESGWELADYPWFIERYNCPRFTTPDEKGNVILDYCAYLK
ncbi:MAG TPA: GyrI-like domain-containing protein [Clostridiales bacterium]|nr:GyrI-like domain-containing protein [Clostridiales bacterium]